ncbi:MAG: hypothetical protein FWD26_01660 [Treponema sp.]|nr:hypothetical protein [Treponema sp.]
MKKKFLVVLGLLILMSSCARQTGFDGADTFGPIKINYVAENRFFKYNHSSPLTMPDGSIIKTGDLKPFWQWVERKLGIELEDVTTQSRSNEIIQTQSATGFKDANIYGGNSTAEDLMTYGTQGYFLELGQFIDNGYMPNFKTYLENNGSIREAITAYDGGIYFVPYIAEIGYFARAFMCRQSWVSALLDLTPQRETAALKVSYPGYWHGENARHSRNVIVMQNEAAVDGVLSFNAARDTLINYIKETYPSLEKPSQLFLGSKAQFDIDELAALWRVIRLAPNTLSRLVTGTVVPNADIVPYFFRQTSYREDLLRLANYFNGQRVFGSDSYESKFYLDKDGVLQFSYAQDNMLDNILPLLKTFYDEGLIAPDFATLSLRDNFRNIYFGGDLRTGHSKFGFMTFDFIPSTTAVSLGDGRVQSDVEGILPPLTRIPGVTDGFVHFIENTRVIKPDGWAISSVTGGEKLKQCLLLFDFMFSAEGSTAQNFGMPEMIDIEPFIGSGGIAYPRMSSWFNEQSALYSNGDGALFSRNFIGFNFPVGYEKSIGFEQQFTSVQGERTWKLYEDADVLSVSYNKTSSPYFSLVPPVFSLTSRLQRQLLATNIGATQVDMIFTYITAGAATIAQIKDSYNSGRITDYIEVYRDAYDGVKR